MGVPLTEDEKGYAKRLLDNLKPDEANDVMPKIHCIYCCSKLGLNEGLTPADIRYIRKTVDEKKRFGEYEDVITIYHLMNELSERQTTQPTLPPLKKL